MGEWLKPAVLKTDFTFPANCTIQSKSLCLPAVCADFDFTLVPSISRVLTMLLWHFCDTNRPPHVAQFRVTGSTAISTNSRRCRFQHIGFS